jgi:hypothetical protein
MSETDRLRGLKVRVTGEYRSRVAACKAGKSESEKISWFDNASRSSLKVILIAVVT